MKKTTTCEVIGDFSMSGLRRMQAPGNLRAGRQVKGSSRSIEDDSSSPSIKSSSNLQQIVLAYVVNGDKVLAVSRGNDMTNFNIPGGHVESGEDPKDACVRELWEETGLRARELFPVYSKVIGDKLVTTYKVDSYSGSLRPSLEGVPDWVTPDFVISSQFGEHFKSMLESLSQID